MYTQTITQPKTMYKQYTSDASQAKHNSTNNIIYNPKKISPYEDLIKKARDTLTSYHNTSEIDDNSNKNLNNSHYLTIHNSTENNYTINNSTNNINNNTTNSKNSYREIKYSNESINRNSSNPRFIPFNNNNNNNLNKSINNNIN